jgi:hypothetical protein
MPHSDAADPEMRASPVASFSWNSAPRANDPAKRPLKKSLRNRRWPKPLTPRAPASVSLTAQPMSSWPRT